MGSASMTRWAALAALPPLAMACVTAASSPEEARFAAVPPDATWAMSASAYPWEHIESALAPTRASLDAIEPAVEAFFAGLVTDGELPPEAAGIRVVLSAVAALTRLDRDALVARLGVREPLAMVAYGAPFWPVVRLELADPGLMRAALSEAVAELAPGARARHGPGDATSWELPWSTGRDGLLVGVADGHLVLALWGEGAGPAARDAIMAPPRGDGRALRDELHQVSDRLGVAPDLGVGQIRLGALVTELLRSFEPHGPEGERKNTDLGPASEAETLACQAELASLVRGLPRLAGGFTTAGDTSTFAMEGTFDDEELARAVSALGGRGRDLAVEPFEDPDVLLSVSLDLARVGDLVEMLARRMAARRYTCPSVRTWGEELAELSVRLGVAGRLLTHGLRSLHVRVDRFDPTRAGVAAFATMLRARAVAVVVHDHPEDLLSLARMGGRMAGGLSLDDLTLADGGPPQVVRRMLPRVVAARRGALLGVAAGPGSEGHLEATLAGGTTAAVPLLAYGFAASEDSILAGLPAVLRALLESAPVFPDVARVEGRVLTVGAVSLDAADVYGSITRAGVIEATEALRRVLELFGETAERAHREDSPSAAVELNRLEEVIGQMMKHWQRMGELIDEIDAAVAAPIGKRRYEGRLELTGRRLLFHGLTRWISPAADQPAP